MEDSYERGIEALRLRREVNDEVIIQTCETVKPFFVSI